ncbi:helix-turn-helix domain-containing protein [Halomonas sp. 707B3]|uniref:helix-turn-helix domain-containing protein n=1 Tax=Halomonas sp. 707B3 TaxID=1681043 RepID=UPI0020A05324|nr:helix-turn-helix transcriptional regulator [Halomonas sp. 707B3]MCP1317850.1 helix-turn-helix domain-containing protein [Halomonas sp. 707B3]
MPAPTRLEVAEYNRAVGARIREARQLAGFNLADLSLAVGVERDLMPKLEFGTDLQGGAAPWVLHRIAVTCGVKVDFLLGLTGESEPDEPGPTWREIAHVSNGNAARERERHVSALTVRDAHIAEFRELAVEVMTGVEAVQGALERVIELNPSAWEDMRAGSRLSDATDALSDVVGALCRRSSAYVDRQMISDAPDTLLELEIAAA